MTTPMFVVQCHCMSKPSLFERKSGELSAEQFVRRHHAFVGHHPEITEEQR